MTENNEKMIRIYECDDSIDGILSGIYQAWDASYGHDNIKLTVPALEKDANLELFSEYRRVITNAEQAEKVAQTLRDKISVRVYETVIRALFSNHPQKANAVYHILPKALRMGGQILGDLTDPYVQAVFEMNRYVENEAHLYLGFLRFEEMKSGVMLAQFEPQNDLLEVITPHFETRFERENFIIYDTGRGKASFHSQGYPFIIREVTPDEMLQFSNFSAQEDDFQRLWRTFFKTIAIQARKNPKLQRNMLPLHYRRYMTEFLSDISGHVQPSEGDVR